MESRPLSLVSGEQGMAQVLEREEPIRNPAPEAWLKPSGSSFQYLESFLQVFPPYDRFTSDNFKCLMKPHYSRSIILMFFLIE